MNFSLVVRPKCLFSSMNFSISASSSVGSITERVSMASMASWYVYILPVCAISVPTVAVSFLWMSSEILSGFIPLSSLSEVASSRPIYSSRINLISLA